MNEILEEALAEFEQSELELERALNIFDNAITQDEIDYANDLITAAELSQAAASAKVDAARQAIRKGMFQEEKPQKKQPIWDRLLGGKIYD